MTTIYVVLDAKTGAVKYRWPIRQQEDLRRHFAFTKEGKPIFGKFVRTFLDTKAVLRLPHFQAWVTQKKADATTRQASKFRQEHPELCLQPVAVYVPPVIQPESQAA